MAEGNPLAQNQLTVGRYALFSELASGGMGVVQLGRLMGAAGFSRTVAIKRLHRHLATNDEFVTMFMDEARIASRIHHPNVVPTLDVVLEGGELLLVMDYLDGEPLSRLQRAARARGGPMPVDIAVSVMIGALHGLHAAHEAKSERGEALGIVHRDISPQNIMVGIDGVARVVDFGIAKAASRATMTAGAIVKGKLTYMAPEQINQVTLDRRTDVFAAAIVLWELLTGQRLFAAEEAATTMTLILESPILAPGTRRTGLSAKLDAVVLRGLARSPAERFPTAMDFAEAIEEAIKPATQREVGRWVATVAADSFAARARKVADIETQSVRRPAALSIAPDAPPSRPLAAPTAPLTPATPEPLAAPVEPSQVSSLAVVSASRTSNQQVNLWAVLGCVVLGIGAAAGLFVLLPSQPLTEAPESMPVAGSQAASAALSPLPSASAAASVEATAMAISSAKPAVGVDVGTPKGPRVGGASKAGGNAGKAGSGGGNAGPDCIFPYKILPDGTKRFREECTK